MTEDKPSDQQSSNQSDSPQKPQPAQRLPQQPAQEKSKDESRFAPSASRFAPKAPAQNEDVNRFAPGNANVGASPAEESNPEKSGLFSSGMDGLASKTQTMSVSRGTFDGADVPVSDSSEESRVHRSQTSVRAYVQQEPVQEEVYIDPHYEKMRLLVVGILIIPVMIFSYFPAIQDMVKIWYRVQDYSHGFLIIPLVAYFLWIRIDTYPGTEKRLCWWGLAPLLFCCAARYYGSLQYRDAVEQWSIFFWILGVIWLFYGTRVFLWALPSLSFMLFMFPFPYTFEMMMRQKLQLVAANFAVFLLQTIGQPAVNIGTTIYLGIHEIGVEAACSGIRFMISFFAIGIGTILLLRRPWWNNLIILAGIVPIALFINAIRIVITSMFIKYGGSVLKPFTDEKNSLGKVADQFAGYIAIGLAFLIFGLFIYYLTRVIRKVKVLEPA